MLKWTVIPCLVLFLSHLGRAADGPAWPNGLPPVIGMAVIDDKDAWDGPFSPWTILLTLPKLFWETDVEEVGFKGRPIQPGERGEYVTRLELEVAKVTRTLHVNQAATQLKVSRVVNLKGEQLNRDQIVERLTEETPVLVSVSGQMIDSYYLQLTRPDTLIVILGFSDGSPAPGLLPERKATQKVRILTPDEAARQEGNGETATVEFVVRSCHPVLPDGRHLRLFSAPSFKDKDVFVVHLTEYAVAKTGVKELEKSFLGKKVRVKGKVEKTVFSSIPETRPGIFIDDPACIEVVEEKD